MPVFEQGYRPYDGELERRSPIIAMAWQSMRTRMRWWVWIVVVILLIWPYAIPALFVYLATLGQDVFGAVAPRAVDPVAFATSEADPGYVLTLLSNRSPALIWQSLKAAALANAVVPALACAGILSSDRATGAMQIYFSRPVSRFQYLASKVLAVCGFSALVTAIPCMLLWLECVALSRDVTYLFATWHMPIAIVAASSIYALWTTGVVLAISATLKRAVMTRLAVLAVFIAMSGISEAVVNASKEKVWRVLNPYYSLGGLTAPMFGMKLPTWLESLWMPVAGLGLPVVLLAYVWWRIRSVEVST